MTFRYVLTFLLLLPNTVLGAAGLTYHGRLIAPSGVPVTSSVVRFRIQVRTPGSEDCLMYEEEQIRDLSQTQGVFELTIGANVAYRRDSTGLSFDRIFSNYGTFNLPGLCGLGSSYTPGYADNRRLEVAFNDGTFSGWEPMPTQAVNYVPTALSALQVGGFTANSLLRVEGGAGPQNISSMSFAQFTELMSLILGTSTQYMKTSATGASLPSFASDPSGVTAGQMWYDSAGNVVKFYNGSTVQTLGISGSGISSLTAGTGLTGGTITTSGTIALATAGTAGTYYQVTTDAYGRVTAGQSSLLETDIPNITTAGKVSGSAITSGTIGGSTAISTSGSIQTTGDVTTRRNILYDHSGVGPGFVGLQSPADMSGVNYTLTFPLTAGTAGQVLSTTNTSGALAWTNPVATDLSTIVGTGIVQRNGANSYSTVNVVAPLSYSGGNLGLNAGSGGILLDGGNTVTGTLSAGTISNHNVEIKTANTTRMTVDTSGNVGIGTTAPSYLLDVRNSTNVGQIHVSGTGGDDGLYLSAYGANAGYLVAGATFNGTNWVAKSNNTSQVSPNNGNLFFYTDSGLTTGSVFTPSPRMTLLSSGNVGIGTTNPSAQLHIASSTSATLTVGTDGVTPSDQVAISLVTKGPGSLNSPSTKGWAVSARGNAWTGSQANDLGFYFYNGTTVGEPALQMTDSGNVGIGTANPVGILDVVKNGGNSVVWNHSDTFPYFIAQKTGVVNTNDQIGALQFRSDYQINGPGVHGVATENHSVGAAGSRLEFLTVPNSTANTLTRMIIDQNGNVGIGTTNPTTALEVNGIVKATSFEGTMVSSGASNTGGYTINTDSNASGSDGGFNFQIRGSTVAQISNDGGFFINRTPLATESFAVSNAPGKGSSIGSQSNDGSTGLFVTPNATSQVGLIVRGLASQSAALFQVQDSAPSDKFVVAANGNVGIGTSNPGTLLDLQMNGSGGTQPNFPIIKVTNTNTNHENGTSAYNYSMLETNAGNGVVSAQFLSAYNSAGLTDGAYVRTATNHPLNFGINGFTRMMIDTTGNVGIGTTSPSWLFETHKLTGATNTLTNPVGISASSTGTPSAGFGSVVQFKLDNSVNTQIGSADFGTVWVDPTSGSEKGAFFIRTLSGGTLNERLRVTDTGNVGIGTATPTDPLFISSPTGAGKNIVTLADTTNAKFLSIGFNPTRTKVTTTHDRLTLDVQGNDALSIVQSGNVGIGTTVPGSLLSLAAVTPELTLTGSGSSYHNGAVVLQATQGTAARALGSYMHDTGGQIEWFSGRPYGVGVTGGSDNFVINRKASTAVHDASTAAPANTFFTINSSGNVGIGTTSPIGKLNVTGQANAPAAASGSTPTGLAIRAGAGDSSNVLDIGINNTGSTYAWIQSTMSSNLATNYSLALNPNGGNVGIGTTSPTALFNVFSSSTGGTNFDLTSGDTGGHQWRLTSSSSANGMGAGKFVIGDVTASATRFVIDTAGNVGIGTTSPGSLLHVEGTASVPFLLRSNANWQTGLQISNTSSGAHDWSLISTGVTHTAGLGKFLIYDNAASLNRLAIDTNGNVGIGTTSPGAVLDVRNNANSAAYAAVGQMAVTNNAGGSNFSRLLFNQISTNMMGIEAVDQANTKGELTLQNYGGNVSMGTSKFFMNGTTGNVGIGTANPSYKLDVQGGDINASGSVRAAGVALTSDIRYKRDIESLPEALDKILRLRGVSYNWRTQEFPQKHFNDRHQIGVIAQEVEAQFPEVVDTGKDGYKSVNYAALVAPLIEGVKTLYRRVVGVEEAQLRQEREVASLKNENQLKDKKIKQLENENTAIKQWICAKDPKAAICN